MPFVINETGLRFGVFSGKALPNSLTATIVAKGAFSIRPDAPAEIVPEDDQPQLDGDKSWGEDPARGLRTPSDFAPFKPGADIILAGHCHAPGGRPVPFTNVSFTIGPCRREAVVFGDRIARRGLAAAPMSDPVPFVAMPLDWSRAFGGPKFPANPVGRGQEEVVLDDGSKARLVPNVETMGNLFSGPGSSVPPTGFGPIDPNWVERGRKVGTYSGNWLAERWPWFPDDFDWTFFNAAPGGQFLSGGYLRGDEPLEFIHLDPQYPKLSGALPGLTTRCFVRVRRNRDLEFREVPMRLDTLVADMDERRVVLTWRGVTPVASLKLKEVEDYFLVLEPIGSPQAADSAGYEALFLSRREKINSEFDVEPVILDPPVMPTLTPPSLGWADRLGKLADKIKARAGYNFPPPPPPAGVSGAPLPAARIPPAPPPPKSPAEANAQAKADWAAADAIDPRFSGKYPQPDYAQDQKDFEELQAYDGIQGMEAPEMGEDWTRERVMAHRETGGTFDEEDLAGLDLSRIDFSGCSFIGADLEGVDFTGCDLRKADLTRATLTGSTLDKARLDGAVLKDADLSGIQGNEITFSGADLTDAEFSGSKMPGARFDGIHAPGVSFSECALPDADFERAMLEGADFSEAILPKARFIEARMARADLDGAEATGAVFTRASAFNMRASKAGMAGASFRDCVLDEAVMEESVLNDTDFRGARLRMSTLTGSQLARAVFGLADLREAKLDDIVARDATFVGTNMFRGTLERADITGTSFLDCNLYEVELYQATVTKARFVDTNLKGTKLAGP